MNVKKCITMIISLLIFFSSALTVNAEERYYGNYTYTLLKNKTIKLVSYDGNDERINIPSKIKGKKVTVLGKNLFRSTHRIISVKIPEGITQIETEVFKDRKELKTVNFPKSLTQIGEGAFEGCKLLKSIELGNKIKYIGNGAFLGTGYFYNADNWDGKKVFGGGLYIGKYMIYGQHISGDYNVKTGTVLIADGVFDYCYDVESIKFPLSVKYINTGFNSTKKLKKIKGYYNTVAEKYAKKNGVKFVALNPKTPKFKVKSGKKSFKVTYKKVKGAVGFQVKYKQGKTWKTKLYKTKKTVTKKIKAKKGTCKLKIRSYKKEFNQKIYSKWTKAKKVTVK